VNGTTPIGFGIRVGGLVGLAASTNPFNGNIAVIDQSYSTGPVTGGVGSYLGGLVGVFGHDTVITRSYSTSQAGAAGGDQAYVGGLVGLNLSGSISASYASGVVNGGLSGIAGGVAGTMDANWRGTSVVSTSTYWDTQATGQSAAVGQPNGFDTSGLTGKSTADLKSTLPTGFSSSDWAISASVNSGYPYLQWQTASAPTTPTTTLTGAAPTVTQTQTTLSPDLTAQFFNQNNSSLLLKIDTRVSGSTPLMLPISSRSTLSEVLTWVKTLKGEILTDFETRNARAIDYVADNKAVQDSIISLLTTRASAALYGPVGDVAADIILNIKATLVEIQEFKNGKYYEGTLKIINQVSSLLLSVLPYGGTSANVLNVAGAVATAYVYGFFFGQ
jgi:hypothetical protein